jgi:hypothetical protein
MAIDVIARGLASSILDSDGRVSSNKMPTLNGTAELTGFTSIGKLTDPSLIEGKTAEEILLMMLYGIVSPTLTNPSFSVILKDDMAPLIIGRESLVEGALTFDRGSIDPAFGTSGYRVGAVKGYTINDETIDTNVTSYDFSVAVIPTSDIVTLDCSVSYAAGEQPLNSVGKEFGSAFPAGKISKTLEIAAHYPLYTPDGAERAFTWFEDEDGAGYLSSFASEANGERQSFAVSPETTVIGVKSYNTLMQRWEWLGSQTAAASLTYFNISLVDNQYILYTYNSTPVGARELRVYVE